jgi:hypothetical protein
MLSKRVTVLMISAAIAIVIFGFWLTRDVRERHKAAEREVNYQTVLAKYSSALKPGMTREQVERYFQSGGTRFRQMCCVANFKGQPVSVIGAGWDDLVKIGEESVPFVCSENNGT